MEMKPYFLVQRIKPARGYPKAGIPGLARYFLDSKRKLKQALKESLDALQDIIPLDYMDRPSLSLDPFPSACLKSWSAAPSWRLLPWILPARQTSTPPPQSSPHCTRKPANMSKKSAEKDGA